VDGRALGCNPAGLKGLLTWLRWWDGRCFSLGLGKSCDHGEDMVEHRCGDWHVWG